MEQPLYGQQQKKTLKNVNPKKGTKKFVQIEKI